MTNEVIASAKFVRNDLTKEVQVVTDGKKFYCQHINNGKLSVMPSFVKVDKFTNAEDAIHRLGKGSLAGWRNLLKGARWTEVAN